MQSWEGQTPAEFERATDYSESTGICWAIGALLARLDAIANGDCVLRGFGHVMSPAAAALSLQHRSPVTANTVGAAIEWSKEALNAPTINSKGLTRIGSRALVNHLASFVMQFASRLCSPDRAPCVPGGAQATRRRDAWPGRLRKLTGTVDAVPKSPVRRPERLAMPSPRCCLGKV